MEQIILNENENEMEQILNDRDKPLTECEKKILISNGWHFLNDNYIYIPDDYDGCMAYGIRNIRHILDHYKKDL